jgi:acyl-CoA synthetase (AMP-forming)/AMP-acid ligase II
LNPAVGATDAGTGNPFLGAIVQRWQDHPDALFGMFHDGETWHARDNASFRRRCSQFSEIYRAAGMVSGDIVLLIMEHGVDAHAAFVGAMLIGAVPGFMPSPSVKQDARLYWRQHSEVFTHAKPRAILVYDSLYDAVSDAATGSGARILPTSDVDRATSFEPTTLPNATAIALLQHSSGTTGLKKGVKLSYQAIHDQLRAYRKALCLEAVDNPRFVTWLPLYHDMGLISSFLLPMWLGIPIVSIDPFEWTRTPSLLFDAIEAFAGTHAWVPNFSLRHHVRSARGTKTWDLQSLVAITCCSEPNKPEAFDAFVARFQSSGLKAETLQTCYAMAETVFAMTQSEIGAPVRRLRVDREALQTRRQVVLSGGGTEEMELLSNGRPLDGCDIHILSGGGFAGERIVGEICVSAPYLFSGYHNHPALGADAFCGEWLRTGDLGFMDEGEIFIVGRLKEVIILNGRNVFAHDVEAAVSRVPGVKPGRAVAFGHDIEPLGSEHLVVVAETADGVAAMPEVIKSINRAVIEEVGVSCGDVRLVEPGWLVKTTSGKVSRSENFAKYLELGAEALGSPMRHLP